MENNDMVTPTKCFDMVMMVINEGRSKVNTILVTSKAMLIAVNC